MNMEKNEKMDTCDTDSMTTVNVKDYGHTLDYQEPPPGYRPAKSTTVQVTKIIAVAAVVIAAMLSTALVFSAWVTSTSCQQSSYQSPQPVLEALLQPEHLKSILAFGNAAAPTNNNDLESAESKVENAEKKNNKESSEEDNNNSAEDSGVTMLKLPLELSLQEHMFEKNHRSHMNCVIEKKKAEEIVDEQSKPLPALLGINMSTDPRYLHFSGEKMAISCDSGNDHRQAPSMPMQMSHNQNSQYGPHTILSSRRQPLGDLLSSAIAAAGSASVPIHIIGPIPLTQNEMREIPQQFQQSLPTHPFQHYQQNQYEQNPYQQQQQHHQQQRQHESSQGPFGPFSGIPSHLIPVLLPQGNGLDESSSGHSGQIFIGSPHPQSGEIRERALPHPIPIMPRANVQHVIRPRSVDNQQPKQRVKRCSCDCACKNHPHIL